MRRAALRWLRKLAARGRPEHESIALERTRTEEELRRSEQRYALVMEASDEGFWDWIVATDDFYASPRMLELYGLPPGTMFAGRDDFLARVPFHPEDRSKWQEAVAAHFAGKTARFDIERSEERRVGKECRSRWSPDH